MDDILTKDAIRRALEYAIQWNYSLVDAGVDQLCVDICEKENIAFKKVLNRRYGKNYKLNVPLVKGE